MLCKVISLVYESGFSQNSNNTKKRQINFKEADRCWSNGNGWYNVRKDAHYWLTIETNDGIKVIDIRKQFGEARIRLIEKRRVILEKNLPEYLTIKDDLSGVDETAFRDWIYK